MAKSLSTKKETAAAIGITPRTLENRVRDGDDRIVWCKIGGAIRFDLEQTLQRLMERPILNRAKRPKRKK